MLKRLLFGAAMMIVCGAAGASQFSDPDGSVVEGHAIEDASGNRITPLQAGGSVNVTSLPSLSSGANNIGVVTPLDGATGAGTASAVGLFSNMPVSTAGYNSLYVQITGVGAGTVAFEQSIDGVTWSAAWAVPVSSITAAPLSSSSALAVGAIYSISATGQFRMRLSSYTSGAFSVAWVLKNTPRDGGLAVLLPTTSSQSVVTRPGTSGGATLARIQSTASTNATAIKASAGQLYHCPFYNNGAAAAYVKFYNKASAPNVGTDVPVAVIGLPPSGGREISFADIGAVFNTGISYAITGGPADSDATAVAANQVVGACAYN
ncbi:hypothetical protein SAMN06265338_101725 [Rhodoblastus acidophilus]|uniref:Uncharacterized protein n=2 Tax=Rhodoblastus acidophilus TaxID=1074 RepID=A0A212QL43_RHOAC|nr:hypothetical protein CKO16_03460 [Rhodoblastus acidophilus]RAI17081.1 hypothetical protein CH337_18005 [Rhodoblastus acidophilus]SNB60074.1 hypothetical protein SAMN06265338_101725 [Rhodoblastus acidophilus]